MNLLTDGMGGVSCDSLVQIDWTKSVLLKKFSIDKPISLKFSIGQNQRSFMVNTITNIFSINSTNYKFNILPYKIVFKVDKE